jgi:hypothetical protein
MDGSSDARPGRFRRSRLLWGALDGRCPVCRRRSASIRERKGQLACAACRNRAMAEEWRAEQAAAAPAAESEVTR